MKSLSTTGLTLLLLTLLAGGVFISLTQGSWDVSNSRIWDIILSRFGVMPDLNISPVEIAIIWDGRLPRVLTAALVGFSLAVAGAVMQGIFKNPMASPGVIGISSGAALGAVLAIYLGLTTAIFPQALPLMAIIGALLTLMTVYMIATSAGRTSIATLLLAGIALNLILGAVTSFVITLSTKEFDVGRVIVTWLMGDLNNRLWFHVEIVALTTLSALVMIFSFIRELNILMLGEEGAANLGVAVGRVRNILLLAASIMTGGAIAVAGVIGFVGLVAPHMVRAVIGPDNRRLIPLAGLLGAVFLVYADLFVRLYIPVDLKVGVLTSLLGGPFFIWQIIRYRNRFEYM